MEKVYYVLPRPRKGRWIVELKRLQIPQNILSAADDDLMAGQGLDADEVRWCSIRRSLKILDEDGTAKVHFLGVNINENKKLADMKSMLTVKSIKSSKPSKVDIPYKVRRSGRLFKGRQNHVKDVVGKFSKYEKGILYV